jgi:hypothetical protein
LYFNQLDGTFAQLLLGVNHYGCFHQTADVTAAAANTAYAVSFDDTHEAYGIAVGGSGLSELTVTAAGVYMLNFTAQLDATGGSGHSVQFWLRRNGVNESYSTQRVVVDSGNRAKTAGWSYQLHLEAGDTLELMWAVSDTRAFLQADSATAYSPETPAVVLNMFWLFPAGVA